MHTVRELPPAHGRNMEHMWPNIDLQPAQDMCPIPTETVINELLFLRAIHPAFIFCADISLKPFH